LFRAGEDWHKKTVAISKADLEGVTLYSFKGEKL